MGNNSQAATAIGSTTGGVVAFIWVMKTFFHIEIPAEVAVALLPVISLPLHWLLRVVEAKTGVDVDGNGNVSLPGGASK